MYPVGQREVRLLSERYPAGLFLDVDAYRARIPAHAPGIL
jgi:hypothetical protein